MIVFAGDAVFEPVADKNNTYVLRFEMDEDRYFFWLQVSALSCRKKLTPKL